MCRRERRRRRAARRAATVKASERRTQPRKQTPNGAGRRANKRTDRRPGRPKKPNGLGLTVPAVLSAQTIRMRKGCGQHFRIEALIIRAQTNGADPLVRLMAPGARCTGRSAQPHGSGGFHCPPAPMHAREHICTHMCACKPTHALPRRRPRTCSCATSASSATRSAAPPRSCACIGRAALGRTGGTGADGRGG
jgi:hypothetical protein